MDPVKSYKYILFDLDDTLFDFKASEERALRDTLIAFGVIPSPKIVSRYSEINRAYWRQFDMGLIEKDALCEKRFSDFGQELGLNESTFPSASVNRFYLTHLGLYGILFDGAVELCQTLRARGYKIYIITNGTAHVQHSRLQATGFSAWIDGLYISEEIGYRKPTAEYFSYVLTDIGDPQREHYLIVGDSLTSDIAGGLSNRIDTCWFNPGNVRNDKSFLPTYTVKNYYEILALLQ